MIKLKYVQPEENSVIFFDTLSEWQKSFLNKHLTFEDRDKIGVITSPRDWSYDKIILNVDSDLQGWLVASHPTVYQVLQFNDIFIEEK